MPLALTPSHDVIKNKTELSEQDRLIIKATAGLTSSRDSKDRKRKRINGEDDTDRDLRYAREEQEAQSARKVAKLRGTKPSEIDAPMIDSRGYINLFPEHKQPRNHSPRRVSELEKERKSQREAEEIGGMPLKDALGRRSGGNDAWYLDKDGSVKDKIGRDVWGNEDPRRLERQARRIVSSDPLAFMKQAQAQIKEGRREREERQYEMRIARAREEREFDDFSLDARRSRRDHDRRRDDHRKSHRRRRSRSRSRDRPRHHHRSERSI